MRILHTVAYLALCATTLLAASPPDSPHAVIDSVYHRGDLLNFAINTPQHHNRLMRFGPWLYGTRLQDSRPHDRRQNLYIIVPGPEHHLDGWEEFDHNCVISAQPPTDEPMEWDVYWAIVLDPSLDEDIRDERDLILGAQASFRPADLLEFEDVPAAKFLEAVLKIDSLPALVKFRKKDRTLPRIAIVRANFAISAAVPTSDARSTASKQVAPQHHNVSVSSH